PRAVVVDGQAERQRRGQVDHLPAVTAGLVAARRILGQVIAVRGVGATAAAAADLRELAGAAAAAELGVAEILEHFGAAPEVGERPVAEVAGGHGHVRARRDVALGGDAAVVLAGGTGAVRVVLEQRRG